MFFIDESGSMPKEKDMRFKHRYFVISFIHTENPNFLKNTYLRAIRDLKKHFPLFFSNISNPNELKGSECPPFMKYYIFERLFKNTDIKVAHMVVDNWNIESKFRQIPGRSFNYLIKIIIENFLLSKNDRECLTLKVDNRNTALEGLSELEGYLYNSLVLESGIINKVSVEYMESEYHPNIQIADIVAHTIYQRFRYKTIGFSDYNRITGEINDIHPYSNEFLYNYLKIKMPLSFIYPPKSELFKEVATGIKL